MSLEITYAETKEFKRDFKKLLKKFRTLLDDFETVKKSAIELRHVKKFDNQSVFCIPSFDNPHANIYKIKKIACKSLKGRGVKSGLRIIYAFFPISFRVEFIEFYFKPDQENENQKKIKSYLDNLPSSFET